MRRLFLLLALVMVALPARAQDLTVFAAASLTNALEEAGAAWRAANPGKGLKFSFAASSALARQIEQGAPADIFASADEDWMNYLAERKLVATETRRSLLGNRLVLVMPAETSTRVDLKPGVDLSALLGANGRIATGDPASVPVGKYAREALTNLGLWAMLEPRLARAENVRAALALVERGEAPVGIVYATDAAVAPKVRVAGTFPAGSHTAITYPFAAIQGRDSPAAKAFLAWLAGPSARPIFEKAGFSIE
jgi:molybdate transport system substrate-binding protein